LQGIILDLGASKDAPYDGGASKEAPYDRETPYNDVGHVFRRADLFRPAGACAPAYHGYLVANGELRALPIGSSLDRGGTFYWQPGPGFLGTYQLLFVRTGCDGARERIPVTAQIRRLKD
jgi:hypothetical protein